MTKNETWKAVRQNILAGKTKQETFDELKKVSMLADEDLANIIQSIPSIEARQKYKTVNLVLIILLSLTILFKVLAGIPIVIQNDIKWFPILFIFPVLNIVLLWGIVTFRPGIYRIVAILTILGLLRTLRDVNFSDPLNLIELLIAGGLIGLGFYLHSKLCPSYQIVREGYENSEGEDRLRDIIKFEE